MRTLLNTRYSLMALAFLALSWSFWFSPSWLQLAAGLALFIFGMQSLEQGLKSLAGGRLETWLAQSTATPVKGLMFGCVATFIMQSSTLVSLLTIAFLSTGLITLAGSIAVLFGVNLGATSGIWFLAMAGQNLSMSALAMPLLVFGVLLSFAGEKSKAIGRFLLGISMIFLGIDGIKEGFFGFGDLDLRNYSASGLQGVLLFTAIGTLITVVVQSSHATLMLTLVALASDQLQLPQALCIAVGSNVGSSISTAFMGMIGSTRSGQRLAIAHALFNCATALLSLLLLAPLKWLVVNATGLVGLGSNTLIQLALFHTLFNAMGVAVFWPWQQALARTLERWLPDKVEPEELLAEQSPGLVEVTHARYLMPAALQTADSAVIAVAEELQHLGRLGQEVVAHALYCPLGQLDSPGDDDAALRARAQSGHLDAEQLYHLHIKGVYADLLELMGRMEQPLEPEQLAFWRNCQLAAFQLVDAVKHTRRLQKNLRRYVAEPQESVARQNYLALRQHVLESLREIRQLSLADVDAAQWAVRFQALNEREQHFEEHFRQSLYEGIRSGALDGMVTSSLVNDLGSSHNIVRGLRAVLVLLGEGREAKRQRGVLLGPEPLLADLA